MSDPGEIQELLRALRRGEAGAAEEFVRKYGPIIRQRVRIGLRMRDHRLRRVFDSTDICQSVMASFLIRVAGGQFDLDEPGRLIALLIRMTRNKLSRRVMEQQAQRRDVRRAEAAEGLMEQVIDRRPGAERQVAFRELLDQVYSRMSTEERAIADRRARGHSWGEIAVEFGGSTEGRRKQFSRALDRAVEDLKLEDHF